MGIYNECRMDFQPAVFSSHNRDINNRNPSTQIQKNDITQMPFHILILDNVHTKRNVIGLGIPLLDKREFRTKQRA